MIICFIALVSGILFGFGLIISGMTDPNKVTGFLDISGDWDYSLALVMAGALVVFSLGYFLIVKKMKKSLIKCEFYLPTDTTTIDFKLVSGAILFGLGWGMTGICPAPAIVNIFSGNIEIFVFIGSMVIGILFNKIFSRIRL